MKIDQHLITSPGSVLRVFSSRITLLKAVDNSIGNLLTRLLPSAALPQHHDISPENILLIRPGGMGDAILLVPAIQALKQTYPLCTIDILAEKRNAAVFDLCPQVNRVFHYDRFGEFVSVMRRRYDIVIDTEQWHRLSAVVARLIRSSWKIGFATNERRRMFTHGIDYAHEVYEIESFAQMLKPLGISFCQDPATPFLQVPVSARKKAEHLLDGISGPFVTLFPGASIPERLWGAENFRSLANEINKIGMKVVIVGGKDDQAQGEVIAGDLGLNLAGRTTLSETAAVLEKSRLLVSGDSGVLHLAVGLVVPTVSLFGPGIAEKWAPRGIVHRVINHRLDCSPCTRFGTTPPCPIYVRCLSEITVDEVFREVKALIFDFLEYERIEKRG